MELFAQLSEKHRGALISGLPAVGLLIYIFSSWADVQAGSQINSTSITGVLVFALALAGAGVVLSFLSPRSSSSSEEQRLRKSLEVCQANVMVADNDFNICYMNDSVKKMMEANDSKLREVLPGFNSANLLGQNVDTFHKNPAHQRAMVSGLRQVYKTDLEVNGLTFGLVATPLFSDLGERLGTVVEWYDKTEELAQQAEQKRLSDANAAIAQALKICDTNVMMADVDCNISYLNDSVLTMLKEVEPELRKELPAFNSNQLLGTNIDVFHKNPSHQRNMLASLNQVYRTEINVGELTFGLIATPVVSDEGTRLGTVVEWENKTESLRRSQEQARVAEENLRVRQALDNVTTNAMIADSDGNIVYTNRSVTEMLRNAESDIKKDLPQFNSASLVGTSFDTFHKNPAHQRSMLAALRSTHETEIVVGGRTFKLVANPIINSDNQSIGTVVEWEDRTEEVKIEKEVDHLVASASNGELSVRLSTQGKQGFMLKLSEELNRLMDVTDEVVSDTMRVLSALAHGDLSKKIERDYNGSFGKLKDDANSTVDKLIDILSGISEAANAVSCGADEIAQGNSDLSQRTEEQASSLEETASSMEEMTSVVKQSSQNAQQANDLSTEAWGIAERGGEVVSRAVRAMEEINQSSKKISDIIGVIDEIAFQTNLLALNAAVEAARAGEQGRGFAVVAGEVRNLAQRSAGAAKEIKELIRDSVAKVQDGSDLVNQSGETLEGIVESVQKVSKMIGDITSAAVEQTSGIEQVNTAVAQMDEMTQQNAALVEQASAAGEALSEQARQLMNLITFFNIEGISSSSSVAMSSTSVVPDKGVSLASNSAPISTGGDSIDSEDDWEEF